MNDANSYGIAFCALREPADDFQIFPAGPFGHGDPQLRGAPYFEVRNPQNVIAQAFARKNDFMVDYEHGTLAAMREKRPNPAAGWFSGRGLEWRDEGMFATRPRWTERAAAHIRGDEYRYISPLFPFDRRTGEVLGLTNVGLTNTPAIDGMQSVAAMAASLFNQPQGDLMDPEILKLLGLAEGADDAAVLAALTALQKTANETTAALTATNTEFAALQAEVTQLRMRPPAEVLVESQQQIAALQARIDGFEQEKVASEIERLIDANPTKLGSTKLRDWARTQSLAALTGYLNSVDGIAALQGMQSGGKAPDDENVGVAALTEEDRAVAAALGISLEQFAKTKGAA